MMMMMTGKRFGMEESEEEEKGDFSRISSENRKFFSLVDKFRLDEFPFEKTGSSIGGGGVAGGGGVGRWRRTSLKSSELKSLS